MVGCKGRRGGLGGLGWWLALVLPWWSVSFLRGAEVSLDDVFQVRRFTSADGLAQGTAASVVQTSDGFLWVGTLRGLSRYDGVEFLNLGPESLPGMPPGDVVSLATTDDGQLWVGMDDGLVRLPPGRDRAVREELIQGRCEQIVGVGNEVIVLSKEGVARGSAGKLRWARRGWMPRALAAVPGSPVWCSGTNGLLRLPAVEGAPLEAPVLPGEGGFSLVMLGDRMWGSVDDDLYELDAHTGAVRECWRGLQMWPVLADRQGLVWLRRFHHKPGPTSGAVLVRSNQTILRFPPGGDLLGTSNGRGHEGVDGTRWLCSHADGLIAVRGRGARLFGPESGLPSADTWSVDWTPESGLWACTYRGVARREGERFVMKMGAPLIGGQAVLGLGPDEALWCGRNMYRVKGVDAFPEFSEVDKSWQFLGRDRQGRPIAGGFRGVMRREGPGRWVDMDVPVPPRGGIWIGWEEGPDGEEFLSSLRDGLWRRAPRGAWQPVELPGSPTNAAVMWWEGGRRPWAGSDQGLYRRRDDGGWDRWREQEGLLDNVILSIQPDAGGHLWLSGLRGITRVSLTNLMAVAEGRAPRVLTRRLGPWDGVQVTEGNAGFPSSTREADGTLWFATTRGLVRVRPWELSSAFPPRPLITEVQDISAGVPSSRIPAIEPMTFRGGGGRNLRFRFSAPWPSGGERVRIQYRLDGVDPGWMEGDRHREAAYAGLRPGRYEFRVRAASEDSDWHGDVARWAFEVRPTWWERTWIHATGAMGLLGVLAWMLRRRMRIQRELGQLRESRAVEAERRRLARDMHDGLGSEIARIHLAAATGTVDVAEASQGLLERLRTLVWLTDPAEDRLDAAVDAMAGRVERFFQNAGPGIQLDIAPGLPAEVMDGRCRRELMGWLDEGLANIARHSGATQVGFSARLESGALRLELWDNGAGMDPGRVRPEGRGLGNQRARVEGLGGRLEVRSGSGLGTRLTAIVPWPIQPPTG